MAVEQDFIPFATGGSANVITQSAYAALTSITQNGFQAGIAQSNQLNKVWRQSSIMSAVLAQFIVNQTGQPAIDDGTTATLLANLATAVAVSARQNPVLADTGTANTYVVSNLSAFIAYPTASGLVIDVSIANANTGASTINVDGLGAKPIYGLGLQPLQGGELVVKGVANLLYIVASTVNGGNGAFILMECAGGAQQVASATQSQHAAQFGQVNTGRLLNVQVFTSSGTYTPTTGTNSIIVEGAGGGGAGGGTPSCTASQSAAGAGGGSGAYFKTRITSGFSGATVTVGGAGVGASNATGGNGGSSSFGAFASAPGGVGGTVGVATTSFPQLSGYGNGASVATGGTIINSAGGFGATAIALGSGSAVSGSGGESALGGGANAVINVSAAGNAATSPGAGGSGAMTIASGGVQVGGGGAKGIIIVYEYA